MFEPSSGTSAGCGTDPPTPALSGLAIHKGAGRHRQRAVGVPVDQHLRLSVTAGRLGQTGEVQGGDEVVRSRNGLTVVGGEGRELGGANSIRSFAASSKRTAQ